MDFVSKDLVFVVKDGEVQLVPQLIMRLDNAYQIVQDMETLTSKPKNVSVEVSGLEMTVPKVSYFLLFRKTYLFSKRSWCIFVKKKVSKVVLDSRYTSSKPLLIISNKFYLSSARRRFLLQKFTLECKLFMIYTIRSFVVLNWQLLWANFRLVSSVCRCKVSMLFTEVDYSKEEEKS